MVHRRLLDDDAFGVGEPLNETAFNEGLVARGKHYLIHRYATTKLEVNYSKPVKFRDKFNWMQYQTILIPNKDYEWNNLWDFDLFFCKKFIR